MSGPIEAELKVRNSVDWIILVLSLPPVIHNPFWVSILPAPYLGTFRDFEAINSLFWKALQSLPSSPNPLHIKIVSLTTPPTPRNTKSFGYVPSKIHEVLEVKSTSSMVLLMSGG
eukprot:02274.XXX_52137_52478_1 [CDS] Oithona nana genome sequencing.